MIRAFIAVPFAPTAALAALLDRLAGFGRSIRPASPAQLHLTLRFLGDVDPDAVADICLALDAAVAGTAPFDVDMIGLGAFPRPQRPTVVWVGLREAELLERIVEALDPLLDTLDMTPRDRPWQAHLTVARVKARPPGDLLDLLERDTSADYGVQPITAVALIQSRLTPAGPVYTDLHRIELARPGH